MVEKASKHTPDLNQSEIEERDKMEFIGLTDDAIEEECKEYVYVDASD